MISLILSCWYRTGSDSQKMIHYGQLRVTPCYVLYQWDIANISMELVTLVMALQIQALLGQLFIKLSLLTRSLQVIHYNKIVVINTKQELKESYGAGICYFLFLALVNHFSLAVNSDRLFREIIYLLSSGGYVNKFWSTYFKLTSEYVAYIACGGLVSPCLLSYGEAMCNKTTFAQLSLEFSLASLAMIPNIASIVPSRHAFD